MHDRDLAVPLDDAHFEQVARASGTDVHHEPVAEVPGVDGERLGVQGIVVRDTVAASALEYEGFIRMHLCKLGATRDTAR